MRRMGTIPKTESLEGDAICTYRTLYLDFDILEQAYRVMHDETMARIVKVTAFLLEL